MKVARYKTEVITDNTYVDTEKCNSISFENIGQDNATINSDIPLTINDSPREFKNDPDIIIKAQFAIKFSNNSTDKKILIIKKFLDELPGTTNKSTVNSGCDRRC